MEHINFITEDIIKLLISAGTGAIIGFEREYHSKSAGLRTIMLIAVGSTAFTLVSMKMSADATRIVANIVTGIGFIGGGIIFRENNRITGITTAAAVWVTAALGTTVGVGHYETGFVVMVLVVTILYGMVPVQNYIKRKNQIRNYRIVCKFQNNSLKYYEEKFEQHHLEARPSTHSRSTDTISGTWIVQGSEKNHERVIKALLRDPEVLEFDF
jgi:putative Mg2+ transporter-C (MgtC) family protein